MDIEQCYGKIKNTPLFEGCAGELVLSLLKSGKICAYRSGQSIDLQGRLVVILSGGACVHSVDKQRNLLLRRIREGEIVGAAGLFCADKPFSAVVAKGVTEALLIDAAAVKDMLEKDCAFMYNYITFLSRRVSYLNRKITFLTAGSAKRKLAVYLDSFESDAVTLPLNLSAVSDMLDIGRASLYRALDEMEGYGCLSREGNDITITDRNKLKEILGGK